MSCESCHEQAWRYTCPRCRIKTCSLSCVERHKRAQACSGRRDVAEFVPIRQYGDLHGWRDVNYLNDVDRELECWRKRKTIGDGTPRDGSVEGIAGREMLYFGNGVSSLHPLVQAPTRTKEARRPQRGRKKGSEHGTRALIDYCSSQSIRLHTMPFGMRRHTQNTSRLVSWQSFLQAEKSRRKGPSKIKWAIQDGFAPTTIVLWTVELRFRAETRLVHNVPDFVELQAIFDQSFAETDTPLTEARVISAFGSGLAKSFSMTCKLAQALTDMDIVEYPTISFDESGEPASNGQGHGSGFENQVESGSSDSESESDDDQDDGSTSDSDRSELSTKVQDITKEAAEPSLAEDVPVQAISRTTRDDHILLTTETDQPGALLGFGSLVDYASD